MTANGLRALQADRFDPIDLDELIERAAMLTRVDRKYILRREEAEAVLQRLDPTTRVLEIDGERSFGYESVYFDTPDLLSYRMAATARRRRFKLRTRSYLDSGDAFLEMKTRGARSATVKERIPYDIDERETLTHDGRDYADAALVSIGVDHPDALELRPTLITRYDRTTLYQPSSMSRATIDTALTWETDDGTLLELPELALVETKSGSRASDADRLLWANGHRPATVSKYATGLAAMRGLPANKWSRVLRRYFPDHLGSEGRRVLAA